MIPISSEIARPTNHWQCHSVSQFRPKSCAKLLNAILSVFFTGEALDIFYRYGFFSLSVRVVPRDDPGKWLIREPTASIFEEPTVATRVTKGSNNFNSQFEVIATNAFTKHTVIIFL